MLNMNTFEIVLKYGLTVSVIKEVILVHNTLQLENISDVMVDTDNDKGAQKLLKKLTKEKELHLIVKFSAIGLKNTDLIGKSDPYLEVWTLKPQMLRKTEWLRNNLNPSWKAFSITQRSFAPNWKFQNLVFKIFDRDLIGKNDLIGQAECNSKIILSAALQKKSLVWRLYELSQTENSAKGNPQQELTGRLKMEFAIANKDLTKIDQIRHLADESVLYRTVDGHKSSRASSVASFDGSETESPRLGLLKLPGEQLENLEALSGAQTRGATGINRAGSVAVSHFKKIHKQNYRRPSGLPNLEDELGASLSSMDEEEDEDSEEPKKHKKHKKHKTLSTAVNDPEKAIKKALKVEPEVISEEDEPGEETNAPKPEDETSKDENEKEPGKIVVPKARKASKSVALTNQIVKKISVGSSDGEKKRTSTTLSVENNLLEEQPQESEPYQALHISVPVDNDDENEPSIKISEAPDEDDEKSVDDSLINEQISIPVPAIENLNAEKTSDQRERKAPVSADAAPDILELKTGDDSEKVKDKDDNEDDTSGFEDSSYNREALSSPDKGSVVEEPSPEPEPSLDVVDHSILAIPEAVDEGPDPNKDDEDEKDPELEPSTEPVGNEVLETEKDESASEPAEAVQNEAENEPENDKTSKESDDILSITKTDDENKDKKDETEEIDDDTEIAIKMVDQIESAGKLEEPQDPEKTPEDSHEESKTETHEEPGGSIQEDPDIYSEVQIDDSVEKETGSDKEEDKKQLKDSTERSPEPEIQSSEEPTNETNASTENDPEICDEEKPIVDDDNTDKETEKDENLVTDGAKSKEDADEINITDPQTDKDTNASEIEEKTNILESADDSRNPEPELSEDPASSDTGTSKKQPENEDVKNIDEVSPPEPPEISVVDDVDKTPVDDVDEKPTEEGVSSEKPKTISDEDEMERIQDILNKMDRPHNFKRSETEEIDEDDEIEQQSVLDLESAPNLNHLAEIEEEAIKEENVEDSEPSAKSNSEAASLDERDKPELTDPVSNEPKEAPEKQDTDDKPVEPEAEDNFEADSTKPEEIPIEEQNDSQVSIIVSEENSSQPKKEEVGLVEEGLLLPSERRPAENLECSMEISLEASGVVHNAESVEELNEEVRFAEQASYSDYISGILDVDEDSGKETPTPQIDDLDDITPDSAEIPTQNDGDDVPEDSDPKSEDVQVFENREDVQKELDQSPETIDHSDACINPAAISERRMSDFDQQDREPRIQFQLDEDNSPEENTANEELDPPYPQELRSESPCSSIAPEVGSPRGRETPFTADLESSGFEIRNSFEDEKVAIIPEEPSKGDVNTENEDQHLIESPEQGEGTQNTDESSPDQIEVEGAGTEETETVEKELEENTEMETSDPQIAKDSDKEEEIEEDDIERVIKNPTIESSKKFPENEPKAADNDDDSEETVDDEKSDGETGKEPTENSEKNYKENEVDPEKNQEIDEDNIEPEDEIPAESTPILESELSEDTKLSEETESEQKDDKNDVSKEQQEDEMAEEPEQEYQKKENISQPTLENESAKISDFEPEDKKSEPDNVKIDPDVETVEQKVTDPDKDATEETIQNASTEDEKNDIEDETIVEPEAGPETDSIEETKTEDENEVTDDTKSEPDKKETEVEPEESDDTEPVKDENFETENEAKEDMELQTNNEEADTEVLNESIKDGKPETEEIKPSETIELDLNNAKTQNAALAPKNSTKDAEIEPEDEPAKDSDPKSDTDDEEQPTSEIQESCLEVQQPIDSNSEKQEEEYVEEPPLDTEDAVNNYAEPEDTIESEKEKETEETTARPEPKSDAGNEDDTKDEEQISPDDKQENETPKDDPSTTVDEKDRYEELETELERSGEVEQEPIVVVLESEPVESNRPLEDEDQTNSPTDKNLNELEKSGEIDQEPISEEAEPKPIEISQPSDDESNSPSDQAEDAEPEFPNKNLASDTETKDPDISESEDQETTRSRSSSMSELSDHQAPAENENDESQEPEPADDIPVEAPEDKPKPEETTKINVSINVEVSRSRPGSPQDSTPRIQKANLSSNITTEVTNPPGKPDTFDKYIANFSFGNEIFSDSPLSEPIFEHKITLEKANKGDASPKIAAADENLPKDEPAPSHDSDEPGPSKKKSGKPKDDSTPNDEDEDVNGRSPTYLIMALACIATIGLATLVLSRLRNN